MNIRRFTLVAAVLAVIGVLAGLPVYVFPQVDELRAADAVIVLGGSPYERFEYGIDLAEQGYAPRVVLSNSVGPEDPRMQQICGGDYSVEVECFVPSPWSTRGEAEEIERLSLENGWNHIIVVTYTPHLSRARFIVEECYSGELTMAASPTHQSAIQWVESYIYQTAGYAKALLSPSCNVEV
ncbi:YdcF family protein [Rhodococcus sp. P1Y]|uniref:YdcF family protein n=1 Tax=Rhodococcus sp. P1Y TaxID=1302308 RepID=UPI000EAC5C2E|nr:YdcF family protein [Rhodococcus sp. P1Y]AYJ48177.1 YdcF family protein [Rhodococcus sp. P1Y]